MENYHKLNAPTSNAAALQQLPLDLLNGGLTWDVSDVKSGELCLLSALLGI
jgi:hypothetical protein